MISVQRLCLLLATAVMVVLAAGGSGVRADDLVMEDRPGLIVEGQVGVGQGAEIDLGQVFDSQAFGGVRGGWMVMPNGPNAAKPAADELTRRLEPVRQRAEAKIATVDRIVGLSEKQRKKLESAAQADLRRLTDTVAEARAKYAGRRIAADPRGGVDEAGQKVMRQAQEDGERCGQLVQAACGPESLLSKVVVGTLDEEQAKKYVAVMQGRALCRWKAVVAAGLAQIDEHAGFAQKQHDAITALLMADPPPADDDGQSQSVRGAGMEIAQRLEALDQQELAAILDPRQRQVVAGLSQQAAVMVGGGMF